MRALVSIPFFLLTLCITPVSAQGIEWKEDRPLTWADFQGQPDFNNAGAAAVIRKTIYYSYKRVENDTSYNFTFYVQNVMETKISWVKRRYMSDYLLGHEQLHFDIYEIHARKLAAAFKDAIYTKDFDNEIKAIFDKTLTECYEMNARYDRESKHGNDGNMQFRWQLFVYLELKKLPRNY